MSWHRRLVQCTLAVGALMSSCSSGPSTEGGCPGATYPDWQTSPYVLPIAVGQSVKIDLSNCSGSYHSLGEPDAYAIDFKMAIGTRVVAARGGTVVYVQESGNDGGFPNNLVAVNHGDGTYGQYMHLTRDGAEVTVGTRVEPGDLIATLDDDSVMKLDVSVPSIYLASLRSGLMISASTDAYADRSFTGKVSGVDSRIDPVTRTVRVRALLPNRERLLKPGMLMQVTVSNNRRDALAIPEAALMPVSREQFVLVVVPNGDGHKAERRKISIGGRRPGEVEVLDGLKAGERVVTHGTISVRPGTAVTIKDVDDGSRSVADILQSAPKNAPAVP